MPIALDGDTLDVCLKSDESKPAETRPAFVCRYLTCRQVLKYEQAVRDAAGKPNSEQNDALNAALAIAIIKIRNMPGTLDDVLNDVLTPDEKWELIMAIPDAVSASQLDKKKLLFKSRSTSEKSEQLAESKTGSSSAPTAPATAPPSS